MDIFLKKFFPSTRFASNFDSRRVIQYYMIWYVEKCSVFKFIFGGKMETQRLSSDLLVWDRMHGIYYEVFDVSHIFSEISALNCERLTSDN